MSEEAGFIVEFSGPVARIRMSKEDYDAFQDWQRLSPEEKDHLMYVAKRGKTLRKLIKITDWVAGLGYLVIRAGALAAAIIAVIAVWRNFMRGDGL